MDMGNPTVKGGIKASSDLRMMLGGCEAVQVWDNLSCYYDENLQSTTTFGVTSNV
jgi:hypothetical protein